ncbi:MAG: magnesium/cobalt transporter CorA [Pirellulales bacterium]|nr:magnesium/cobalt transporter CorA [Pirellulales bacterium]
MSTGHRHANIRFSRHVKTPPGTEPGTIALDPAFQHPTIHVIAYDRDRIIDHDVESIDELHDLLKKWPVTWVNVSGLGDVTTLEELGAVFGIHRLALEDVVGVHQRAKVDAYDEHLFVVSRMAVDHGRISTKQISLFVGSNYVLTFQNKQGDCFDAIRSRLLETNNVMRREMKADYLAYRLIDATIDSYFPVLEHFGDKLEKIDEQLAVDSSKRLLTEIHAAKTGLLLLRRAVWPHREMLNQLLHDTHPLISDSTRMYLRDCYDHTVHIMDLLETYREVAIDLRDFYMSVISNRMNEVMKVLTIIATIFIPMSFITGLYGMNFNTEISPWNMPELNWRFGYFFALSAMALVATSMLLFFRHRRWIGSKRVDATVEEQK